MVCEKNWYAIREVSDLTGVKPVTLRAWQRRYNLIQPERTEKGHRLYTDEHIALINEIQGWLAKGISIGKVKALLGSDLPDEALDVGSLEAVEEVLEALTNLNTKRAESVINGVLKEYPLELVERQFITPTLNALALVKQSLRSLHLGLFNTLMVTKLNQIIEAENKVAHRGKCLAINLDAARDIHTQLWALSLVSQGYRVLMIDGVEDLSGLLEHTAVHRFEQLAFYSATKPSESQLSVIKELEVQHGQVSLSEMIELVRRTF